MAKLNDTEAHVLAILYDHGSTIFTDDDKKTATTRLLKSKHVIEYGGGSVAITNKGVNWLNRQHSQL